MKLKTKNFKAASDLKADVLMVGCFESELRAGLETALGAECGGVAARQAAAVNFTGKVGECLVHFPDGKVAAKQVVVFGLGDRQRLYASEFRKALTPAFRKVRELKAAEVAVAPLPTHQVPLGSQDFGETLALCAGLIDYEINHFKTERGGHKPLQHLEKLTVMTNSGFPKRVRQGLENGKAIAKAVNRARDLSNLPANILTPKRLAQEAVKVCAESGGLIQPNILRRKAIEKLGADALLAVSAGSSQEPYLIELTYTPPSGRTDQVLGFVGKSVMFDSGGLDLKTADGMRTMKRDMAGGAAVLAAIAAIAALRLPISVKAFMAATENMPDGNSYKPGDVIVKTLGGLSVEVDNTDAEGRLTLADAIEFAKRQGVTQVIDLATLTGSIREFGGDVVAGAFGNNSEFTKTVLTAAERGGELMAEVPMFEEFRQANHSDIADLKNSGGSPGSVTAAWFIREFVGKTPWVHLDIAGVSYRTRELGLDPKHSTGYGVRTLVELARISSESGS